MRSTPDGGAGGETRGDRQKQQRAAGEAAREAGRGRSDQGAMDSTNLKAPSFTVMTTAALVALRWESIVVLPVTPS